MNEFLEKLTKTDESSALLIIRVVAGIVILGHGCQKVFGWFGGFGIEGTMGYFMNVIGTPWILAVLIILIEFAGSIALILGLFSRLMAVGIGCIMLGAIYFDVGKNGFFMNWSGKNAGEGYEYHLLVLSIVVAIIIAGGGKLSLDLKLHEKFAKS